MKNLLKSIIVLSITLVLINYGWTNELFPSKQIKDLKVIELAPNKLYTYEEFKNYDLKNQNKYSAIWSTIAQINLTRLAIDVTSSSELGAKYRSSYLMDDNVKTAWVEGTKGEGKGEWVKIKLDAFLASYSSTPFSVIGMGIIPGYLKDDKTWEKNNRVKSALLIIHSPESVPEENEWVVYRLKLEDEKRLQYFTFSDDTIGFNDEPMSKTIWLKIEEVYRGSKYNDTCISEVVFVGGCRS